jgi:hypothetical protein
VKSLSWRWLVLAAAVPACVLIEPLDKAVPDSSSAGGDSEAGSQGSAGKHTGSGGSGTQNSGDAAGSSGEAEAGESSGGSAPGGEVGGKASGGASGKASGGTGGKASGGTGGKPSGGSSGAAFGGASPAGGSAGAPAPGCMPPGGGCTKNVDCCQSGAGVPTTYGATCIESDGLCHVNCTDGDECVTGCCTVLAGVSAYGACAAASECACLPEGTSCNAQSVCCGGSGGICYSDFKCHRICAANADCATNCCDTSVHLCAPTASCGR